MASNMSLQGFHPHEILEILLYRNTPLKDTCETAHRLIEKFGSVLKVFQAPPAELKSVKGMTERAALDLAVMYQAFLLLPSLKDTAAPVLDTPKKIRDFIETRLTYEPHEIVYILCLDSANRLINVNAKTENMTQNVALNARTIVKTAMNLGASGVILAHNHPGGSPFPSGEDDNVTKDAAIALAAIDIPLLEHIIVAKDDCYFYARDGFIAQALQGAKYDRVRGKLNGYIQRGIISDN